MMIQEINEAEWLKFKDQRVGKSAIFFYTSMCGTCNLAEQMLEIVDVTGVPYKLYKININFAPKLREDWKISSVPCLVLLRNGQPVQFDYAMHSVVHLYGILKEGEV